MQTLIKTALFASAAMAASIPIRDVTYPDAFRLSVNVTSPAYDSQPSVQGQELVYTPNAGCSANTTFAPAGQGTLFRVAGNTVGVAHYFDDESSPSAGLVITPGGTATVPSTNIVKVQCSNGTTGVSVTSSGLAYDGGSFMACSGVGYDENLPVVLSFRQAGQRAIISCAVIQLLPVY
ncbi:hypothetical protein CkaCkLH20_04749 [Colletotrichum karsti]|uniref:DUF7907 domain-containing protein n=1 Tax=Colletotrichum karsti TaxID=1095194 RepID=A0A9P6I7X9_9PEZI|nr:uncharacterized protein CkaCkLH20_04749 [Colletotrichum karsti]KAF9877614.1 hypothetical protein CkaCkLH20_04749 [Colletotrichum karsti]